MERHFVPCAELRAVSRGDKKRVVGYAAVFDSMSEPLNGYFRETIRPGAFADSLAGKQEVCALVDHEPRMILGRRSAGTLEVREDKHGLYVEIDPPDTSYARDMMTSIDRGDLRGMSFGFVCDDDEWYEKDGQMVRELRKVNVFDVSVVTYPSYRDTEVALRSLDRWKARQPDPLDSYRRKAKLLNILTKIR